LRSALAQVDVSVEVIVVDDGSSDDTDQYVRAISDDRVRIIRHDRPYGVSAARNAGVAAAEGTWVGFLDDDDLWAPHKLRAQLDALEAMPDARWSCVGSVSVDAALRIIAMYRAPAAGEMSARLRKENVIPGGGSGVVVHRDLLASVGAFDTDLVLLEDWDYWIRLSLRSSLASVDLPLTANVMHGENMTFTHPGLADELVAVEHKYRSTGIQLSPVTLRASVTRQQGSRTQAAGFESGGSNCCCTASWHGAVPAFGASHGGPTIGESPAGGGPPPRRGSNRCAHLRRGRP